MVQPPPILDKREEQVRRMAALEELTEGIQNLTVASYTITGWGQANRMRGTDSIKGVVF